MGEGVHNRIARLRTEQGISRRALADALGVHYQTVGYLERGEYSPSLTLALRLAEFFGVPVETVFSLRPFPRVADEAAAQRGVASGAGTDAEDAVGVPSALPEVAATAPARAQLPGEAVR